MIQRAHVYVIAEAGANHNGSVELAKELIDAAAKAGADFVKFQTYKSEAVLTARAAKPKYQRTSIYPDENQLDAAKKIELTPEIFKVLAAYAQEKKISLVSTPFDSGSVDFLIDELHVPFIKISSGDLTNSPMLLQVAKRRASVILSTGMTTLGEIEQALGVVAFGY